MTQLRVRARAVDMLGRQQIAGIPTAIHELFKNAHDAYAERVEVDYFRQARVLVLRDDGYGMTKEDVESRWLTLGTESRVGANQREKKTEWRGPKNLPQRSIMGEKGIGRLAIAVIAPITILMTRAIRPDGLHKLVVAFVHWGLFEQPGLDVGQIDVPLEEFADGTLPTKEDIERLADKVKKNLLDLEGQIDPENFKGLIERLERAKSISPDVLDRSLNGTGVVSDELPLSLAGSGYGTHFIVLPVAPELDDDIDGGSDKESSKLERNLLGFSNAMAFDVPVIRTEFRDHVHGEVEERIGSRSFFSSEDFKKVDQYFEGEFDSYGQFSGVVSIYGKPRKFICNWSDGSGRLAKCGKFSLRYGYVQGDPKESSLTPEDWAEMSSKTGRVGGLYIYRDGIRVLPYGNSDVDWLDIEKRRTLAAKDWYFSYRRGFGFVAISHEVNGALTEKAGREGLRENQAYRDFRSILVNFFKQLAYEFFRKSSPQGDDFNEGKLRYAAQAKILERQRAKVDNRRRDFDEELSRFDSLYNERFFENESKSIVSDLECKVEEYNERLELGDFATRIRLLELEVKQRIRSLYAKAAISLPRGLSLTKRLEKDWAAYLSMAAEVRSEILDPLRERVESIFNAALKDRVADTERRAFALQDIDKEKDSTVRDLVGLRRETADAVDLMQSSIQEVLKDEFTKLRSEIESVVSEFVKQSAEKPSELDSLRHEVETRISEIRSREADLLESLKRQMVELAESVKSRETLDDRFAALEDSNQRLEEQIDFYSEFAQLGMSVGILQHEFLNSVRGIRRAMSELKPWADRNVKLNEIYGRLRGHIEHLDGYLKVLDPLGRRMYRSTVTLSGDEILHVILNVFSEPLDDAKIAIEATFKFRDFTVECKSSAMIGAFINVIDNAIYWLGNRSVGDRCITLDADEQGFIISNTGPGIEEKYKDRIFEFGETRKVGGRGMGLAISREVLKREGFEISLLKAGVDVNPAFRISPIAVTDEGSDEL
ncbi:TPA: ATP-binding protein [Pseudomonas aeruginosa]|uniref:ATP-binding protein n=1 Tax=Pseudomonas aeruginosa TaxID=287 RepID=UPI0005852820|nr:ATP-binding protein [Pseudomonas aeruginosa]APC75093.1 sensory histidine kinase AtoS [Pseudomonas aeruginosa]MDV6599635.1 ATP-binding protein [Pseudomonas aeruginosa]RPR66251.1 ATP-binding protein [Pseudomonas aeruginosa]RPT89018.1 ATP-binding protein [Pseudomonas aeruginosa]HCR1758349.1 ATP-binding protein [Pseudomonas aeruginosa]